MFFEKQYVKQTTKTFFLKVMYTQWLLSRGKEEFMDAWTMVRILIANVTRAVWFRVQRLFPLYTYEQENIKNIMFSIVLVWFVL